VEGNPTSAIFISAILAAGRVHGQRIYFGPTEKSAEAVILNLNIPSFLIGPATNTFNVSLKIYDFKRQLWGAQVTNPALGSSHKNQLQVNGTSTFFTKAQKGDEVTILDGVNAGQIAHISPIANAGASNEHGPSTRH
jgi:hypothetical protein